MSTDATGKSFLSYSSARRNEAELLLAAQHDVGIPTWQDKKDLDEVLTADELRRVLRDPLTANSLIWITPEVASSPFIKTLEIPEILRRLQANDGFFAIPVCAGALDYKSASNVVGQEQSAVKFEHLNLRKVAGNPIDCIEAAEIASRVLKRRIESIHRQVKAEAPLKLSLNTRTQSAFEPGIGLQLLWAKRFEGREATPENWQRILLPALASVSSMLRKEAPGRKVVASGLASIPAAIALGAAFLAPGGQSISWDQYTPGQSNQLWSIEAGRESSGFEHSISDYDVSLGTDLAVLVSVSDNVETAFSHTFKESPPRFRTIVRIAKKDTQRFSIPSPQQANDIAMCIIEGIRNARANYAKFEKVHLFMAVPVGLAMLVGQLLNTLGTVQTYEHVPIDGTGIYRPAALLHPSNTSC